MPAPSTPDHIMVAADVEMSDTPAKAVAPVVEKTPAAAPTAESILAGTWSGLASAVAAHQIAPARGMWRLRLLFWNSSYLLLKVLSTHTRVPERRELVSLARRDSHWRFSSGAYTLLANRYFFCCTCAALLSLCVRNC